MLGHVPAGALRADDDAEQVHRHHPVEVTQIVSQEPAERTGDAGVVEHDVQPAECLHGEVDQRLDLVDVGHVGPPEGHGIAQLGRQRLALLDVHVGDDDLGPFADEELDGGPADPARPPGDDGNLPRRVPGPCPAVPFELVSGTER